MRRRKPALQDWRERVIKRGFLASLRPPCVHHLHSRMKTRTSGDKMHSSETRRMSDEGNGVRLPAVRASWILVPGVPTSPIKKARPKPRLSGLALIEVLPLLSADDSAVGIHVIAPEYIRDQDLTISAIELERVGASGMVEIDRRSPLPGLGEIIADVQRR